MDFIHLLNNRLFLRDEKCLIPSVLSVPSLYKDNNPVHNEKIIMILRHCYLILIYIYMPQSFWKESPKIQDIIKTILAIKQKTAFNEFVHNELLQKIKDDKFDLIKPEEFTCDTLFNIIPLLNNLVNYIKEDSKYDKMLLYHNLEDVIEMIITVISTTASSNLLLYYIPFILSCFEELPTYLYPYFITYSRPFGITTPMILKMNELKSYYSSNLLTLKRYINLYTLLNNCNNPPKQSELDEFSLSFSTKKLATQINLMYKYIPPSPPDLPVSTIFEKYPFPQPHEYNDIKRYSEIIPVDRWPDISKANLEVFRNELSESESIECKSISNYLKYETVHQKGVKMSNQQLYKTATIRDVNIPLTQRILDKNRQLSKNDDSNKDYTLLNITSIYIIIII